MKMNDVCVLFIKVGCFCGLKGNKLDLVRISIFFLIVHGKKVAINYGRNDHQKTY
jgi:hypothetical protein